MQFVVQLYEHFRCLFDHTSTRFISSDAISSKNVAWCRKILTEGVNSENEINFETDFKAAKSVQPYLHCKI